ncbi:hypothetical protein [Ancylobacter terrae]|uniref:hypothetical protein n=1 Tax=Ancylobacter sp. sgz301288 TaxID=3342077 RepID=UPI00385C10FD
MHSFDYDDLDGFTVRPPAELLNPSPEERLRRAESGRLHAEICEGLDRRRAARNPPRAPFAANRSGHEAPEQPSGFPDARPVTIPAVRKVRRRVVSTHAVTMEAGDWAALQSMGYHRLHVADNGVSVGTGSRSVAKLIANAGNGEVVVFRDGDRFNLRRENLVVIPWSLHYRATGHYPPLLSDGRMTHRQNDRTKTKRKAWGLSPQHRLAAILFPAQPILGVKVGPDSPRKER